MGYYNNHGSIIVRGNTEIAEGSLQELAQKQQTNIADAFLGVALVCIVDTSGSMERHDAMDGMSRHDAAEIQLRKVQRENQGVIAVFAFSDDVVFCPNGIPARLNGGTDMKRALRYVHQADDTGIGFVLISDGHPTSGIEETLAVAETFKTPIHTIYVGPRGGSGEEFLRQLAALTGGKYDLREKTFELEQGITALLPG